MEPVYNETLNGIDFTTTAISEGEYESCTFRNCKFAEVNLSHRAFLECEFYDCDFTGSKLGDTAFKDVKFVRCKLLGVDFANCNPFLLEMNFDECLMNLTSFYKLQLKSTTFNKCSLVEADFVEADLQAAKFLECDLAQAQFDQSNLEKSDFRTAINYSLNPNNNRLKGAKFSRSGVTGLLDEYNLIIE